MRILDRYIAGIFIKNLVFAVLGMTALFLFQGLLTELFGYDYTTRQVLTYHFLNVPRIAVQMSAPAVLLATVLTLSSLARTQELVACFAIGVSLRRLMVVILVSVGALGILIWVAEDRLLPSVYRIRTTYYWREMQKQNDFFLDIKRDKVWYRSKNMIYNLVRFDGQSKTIYGMSIYQLDNDFNLVQMIAAEKAEYSSQGWKLINGTVTQFTANDLVPKNQSFKEKMVQIAETPKEFQEIEKEVDGLRLKELLRYIDRMKAAGADTKPYEVKFHSRISLGVTPLVMCLLAIPFSVGGRREGGLAKDLTLCLVTTFFYWLFYSLGLSLGTNGALTPWVAAWLPSLSFLTLALVLVRLKR